MKRISQGSAAPSTNDETPGYGVADSRKYDQFTAKDECSRWTYRQRSTYSAKEFLLELIRHAPFPIRLIQTDNGTEFTNALLVVKNAHKTLFEEVLPEMGIEYKRIRIATPRRNGKVERQHRTDEERFYNSLLFDRPNPLTLAEDLL